MPNIINEKNLFTKEITLSLKGIAILLLLFHHLFYNADFVQVQKINFLFIPYSAIQPIAIMSRICVWIFAFLSAYGLSCQYCSLKYNNFQFIIKRWIALLSAFWIPYLVVFVGYYITVGNPISYVYKYNYLALTFDFLGVADFFKTPMIVGVWWYMCFAQILILLIPILNYICQKFGWYAFPLAFLVLQYLPEGITSSFGGIYSEYFLVIVLAALCANYNFFDKILIRKREHLQNIIELFIEILILISCIIFTYKLSGIDIWHLSGLFSSFAVLALCIIIGKWGQFKLIKKIFIFLGKHSGNMFMVHTFIYIYIPKLIFKSGYAIINYFSLVILSIIASILIEFLKKILHYDILIQKIIRKGVCLGGVLE